MPDARVLLTTEGTYPSVLGGVSTWCDQLVRGMTHVEFHLLELTGPHPTTPAYQLPPNVASHKAVRLWSRGTPPSGREPGAARRFANAFEALMGFARGDLDAFAAGLISLADLGSKVDLWPRFDSRMVWQLTSAAIAELKGEPAPLAEVALAVSFMKNTLAPVLFVPEEADQAHATSNGLCAVPAWIASKAHGVPLMLTEHGLYLRERYLSFPAEQNPPGLKLLRARFYGSLTRLMYAHADLIVSVSEFNRAWQIELGAPPERTRVVYNGVAPEAFPAAEEAEQPAPTVVWVGRIDPIKDLETLIRAFGHALETAPNARLRLFGPVPAGNEEYAARLHRLVDELGLQDSVRFEGPISPVHRAYHAADVVVLSSVSEGFPYAAIEAMMCGRPVVSTKVGGVFEAIGAFGRTVDPHEPVQLGQALAELLVDPQLRIELGARCRERALSLFTLKRMYEGYRNLYGELGAGRPPVPHVRPNVGASGPTVGGYV